MMRPLTGPLTGPLAVSGSTIPGLLLPSEQPAVATTSRVMSLSGILVISIAQVPDSPIPKQSFAPWSLITDVNPYVLDVIDDTYP